MNDYNVGLCLGKFAPLHAGHKYLIEYAVQRCKTTLVVLSFDKRWVAAQPQEIQSQLSLTNRLADIHAYVYNLSLKYDIHDIYTNKYINVSYVDESEVPPYPDGFAAFCNLVNEEVFRTKLLFPDVMFLSEPGDADKYKQYWPEMKYELVDPARSAYNVSATQIREYLVQIEKLKATVERLREYKLYKGVVPCGV